LCFPVMPAQAGIQLLWTPAFAGVTIKDERNE
jgi:hypothetical protein